MSYKMSMEIYIEVWMNMHIQTFLEEEKYII